MNIDGMPPLREITEEEAIRLQNERISHIAEELDALHEIINEFPELIAEQGRELVKAEERTYQAVIETEIAVKNLEAAAVEKEKSRKFFVYAGAGGLAGTALGSAGFLLNPIVGGIGLVAGPILGVTMGGIWVYR